METIVDGGDGDENGGEGIVGRDGADEINGGEKVELWKPDEGMDGKEVDDPDIWELPSEYWGEDDILHIYELGGLWETGDG